jgi:hypothetical protein
MVRYARALLDNSASGMLLNTAAQVDDAANGLLVGEHAWMSSL